MKQTQKTLPWIILLLSASVWAQSCKKQTATNNKIKTLDSIASGSTTLYQCKGSNPVLISDAKIVFDKQDPNILKAADRTEITAAIKDYFSAIPSPAQKLFLDFGGQILISSRVDALCAQARGNQSLAEQEQERVHGCFHYVPDPAGKADAILTLVQRPDAKTIRYYGPQLFGYLYAQFYSRVNSNQKAGKIIKIEKTESTAFISRKQQVANAFLSDMLASKKYNIEILKNLLGENSVSELRSSSANAPLDRLSFKRSGESTVSAEVKAGRISQVRDFFFAHAYQSMHCNADSLNVAQQQFPESTKVFAEVDQALLQLSTQLTGGTAKASSASAPKASSGFGLSGLEDLSSLMPLLSGMGGGAGTSPDISTLFNGLSGGSATVPSSGGTTPPVDTGAIKNLFQQLVSAGESDDGGCPSDASDGSVSGGSDSSDEEGDPGSSDGDVSAD